MAKKVLLGLKLPTDPRWADIATQNIEDILMDHAWCEQKAASNAITIIVKFPEFGELVDEMIQISMEELSHFKMVVELLKKRGLGLDQKRKDPYVNDLRDFVKKGGTRVDQLLEYLLVGAMIEARSCERFKLLSEKLEDPELVRFYNDLMISEAGHYTSFLTHARKIAGVAVANKRWEEYLDYEATLMKKYGSEESIHG